MGRDDLDRLPPDRARGAEEGDALHAVQCRHAQLGNSLLQATDCAALVEAAGGRVTIVEGDERLLKVTTRADLERVAAWLST